MVTIANKIAIENNSSLICPKTRPCNRMMKENSDICAKESEEDKEVLFEYPKIMQIKKVIIGFTMKINPKSQSKGIHSL